MAVTITATPEPTTARVRIEAVGGAAGDPLYVFRRDSAGTGVVRDTSAGTVTWPAVGAPVGTNLIGNADLSQVDETGQIVGLVTGTAARVTRDTAHPVPGGAGWSGRIVWGESRFPAVNRYPSSSVFPRES